jgi:hypothetical protein
MLLMAEAYTLAPENGPADATMKPSGQALL